MMLFRDNVYTFLALYLLFVKGQVTHPVTVGLEGSFYNPPVLSAQINDTVIFQFVGDIHTVTQSTFDDPCTPLPGGFNSGLAGRGTNNTALVPTWNLVITSVNTPIWYFCSATWPSSHCTAGMVGVINPPSISMYNQFVTAAKLVTTPAAPPLSIALTGQGATATSPPTVSIMSSLPLTTKSTPSSPSGTSTSSATKAPDTDESSTISHLGAIVGGAVGGAVGLVGLIIALWLFYRRKRKVTRPVSDDFFRYNPVPVRRPSEVFMEAKRVENLQHNTSITSNTNTNSSLTPSTIPFTPVRRPPMPQAGGPIILEPPGNLRRQASAQSDPVSPSTLSPTITAHTPLEHQPQSSSIDIRSLAQEVAAVLYENPPIPHVVHHKHSASASQDLHRQQLMTIQNPNRDELDYTGIPQTTPQPPPPNYRAATTGSSSPIPRGRARKT